ncbi:putative reverse transcriptase domain-containing protein [Tanacetum coccineum]
MITCLVDYDEMRMVYVWQNEDEFSALISYTSSSLSSKSMSLQDLHSVPEFLFGKKRKKVERKLKINYVRLLVPKCVAMGESRPISDIGGFDIPETVSVVSGGTYNVRDDVMSKRQCIQRSDFNPLDCGPGSSVSMPELPSYSCIVDSGVSSMRSNAEFASYVVTSSCLGDRILDTGCTGPPTAYDCPKNGGNGGRGNGNDNQPAAKGRVFSSIRRLTLQFDHEYQNCPLRFDDKIRFANLLPLEMSDFDIILGMDWLAEHRATIVCHTNRVIFGDLDNPEFIYLFQFRGRNFLFRGEEL